LLCTLCIYPTMSDVKMKDNDPKTRQLPNVEENIGQWEKNLTYWFRDGSIVLRVRSSCYHLGQKKKTEQDLG
jgi:hypothetical protein